jgi:multicomponent Na+:H+ antiporter subunit E
MKRSASDGAVYLSGGAFRWAWLFVLWLVISGAALGSLVIGAIVAALAAWVSLYLVPAGVSHFRPIPLLGAAVRLAWSAVLAGADIARRVFDPRLPIAPGIVGYSCEILVGRDRDIFYAVSSLLPGTVPAGEDTDGVLQVHCLDTGQSVRAAMARDEALLARAMGRGQIDV